MVATEFLHGRPLGPDDLEMIRQQIEFGFGTIEAIDPEVRAIVGRNWPHLLAKLPPEDSDASVAFTVRDRKCPKSLILTKVHF